MSEIIKIESPIYRGKTIQLGNEKVEFNEKGKAEVNRDVWDRYKSFPNIFEDGKTPVVEVTEKKIESQAPLIAELQKQVFLYKGLAEERLNQVKAAKESEKVWREKAAELMKSEVESGNPIESESKAARPSPEMEALKKKFEDMQFKRLQKFLKEEVGLDALKVDAFNKKDELINWALEEAQK